MDYFLHVFFGFGFAVVGLVAPGMLNMTGLKVRLTDGKTQSIWFATGATLIIVFQVSISLVFANFFESNPMVLNYLKRTAIFVFILLAVFFYFQSRKSKISISIKPGSNHFVRGVWMSSINMLAIPYYVAVSLYLASDGALILEQPFIALFVFGATLGSFLLFYGYILLAAIINRRITFVARNINLILSILFLTLGLLTLYNSFGTETVK